MGFKVGQMIDWEVSVDRTHRRGVGPGPFKIEAFEVNPEKCVCGQAFPTKQTECELAAGYLGCLMQKTDFRHCYKLVISKMGVRLAYTFSGENFKPA